jgi:hypothetical protein
LILLFDGLVVLIGKSAAKNDAPAVLTKADSINKRVALRSDREWWTLIIVGVPLGATSSDLSQ